MTDDPCCPDYDNPDGDNGTAGAPISAGGVAVSGQIYKIPARQGRAVRLQCGDRLTIINDHGSQVCDFFAFRDGRMHEFLSMEHCRTSLGRIYVRTGDRLVTNRREALVEIEEDTSQGVHDILIAACDLARYQQLGAEGYHDNCRDNLKNALGALGLKTPHVPSPFNIWMNVKIEKDGHYRWQAPVSTPGERIVLKALAPSIAVMSACPQDMTAVNGDQHLTYGLTFKVENSSPPC